MTLNFFVQLVIKEDDSVFTVPLGLVHRSVSILEQHIHSQAIIREHCHTQAMGYRQVLAINIIRFAQFLLKLLCKYFRFSTRTHIFQHNDKFIACNSGDQVITTDILFHPLSKQTEKLITHVMPPLIIHLFEVVHIQIEHRKLVLISLMVLNRLIQQLREMITVG